MVNFSVGARIGPYELEDEIGRGGMARVFRARQASLNRTVALKVLGADLASDPVFVARFRQEAMIAAALEHPNIVPIYDVGETNGHPYLAMRNVPGRSLAEVLTQDGPFTLGRAQGILVQIASALDYAHTRDVVHRDLKPANILLEANDRASLVDFGIARAGDGTHLTRVGQIAGTPAYMSPEQCRGLAADYRSDLYALGILAYELLSGRVPFHADSDVAVLHQHAYAPLPPLHGVRPDIPKSAERAVDRMVAKRPEERFPSAAAFAAALTDASAAGAGPRPHMPAHRTVWIPAGVAAVALLALALAIARAPGTVDVEGVQVSAAPVAATVGVATAVALTPILAPIPNPTPQSINPQIAPPVDDKADCARRMTTVDAVWETDVPAAISRLEDIVAWNTACGDAPNKLYAARVNLAQSLVRADRANDAVALLAQATHDNPAGGEAVVLGRLAGEYVAGQQAASSTNWPQAISELAKVHAEQPGFADGKADDLLFRAYINHGNGFAAAQQWAQAQDQYAAALTLRPDDASTQVLAARVLEHLQPTPAPPPPTAVPQVTLQTQQDVLASIRRANTAWTNGRASLNIADLVAGLAGQELQDDTAVVNKLRQQGHYVMSHEVSFTATRFTAQGTSRVLVDTRETWYDDVFDLASRKLLTHGQSTTNSETYTVDRINGVWIVTLIQVH